MTFISAIIAKEGVVVSTDSKELLQGGNLLWQDFDDILQKKGTDEEDQKECISPFEITEKFKASAQINKGRIRSIDGATKIFQIGTHSVILVAGAANPSGKEFEAIIDEIKKLIDISSNNTLSNIKDITFSTIEKYISQDKSEDRFSSEYLFCGYDIEENRFKVIKFFFNDKRVMENGQFVKDENGKYIEEKYFMHYDTNQILNTAGWKEYVGELGVFNHQMKSISIVQAFRLSKNIMNLVVTIEEIVNKITGIGGRNYTAIIIKSGFFWVDSETQVMNLMRH